MSERVCCILQLWTSCCTVRWHKRTQTWNPWWKNTAKSLFGSFLDQRWQEIQAGDQNQFLSDTKNLFGKIKQSSLQKFGSEQVKITTILTNQYRNWHSSTIFYINNGSWSAYWNMKVCLVWRHLGDNRKDCDTLMRDREKWFSVIWDCDWWNWLGQDANVMSKTGLRSSLNWKPPYQQHPSIKINHRKAG